MKNMLHQAMKDKSYFHESKLAANKRANQQKLMQSGKSSPK